MSFHVFNRRIHIYAAMFLLPFFLKYAVSAIFLVHADYFNELYEGEPQWSTRFEEDYEVEGLDDMEARQAGGMILEDVGLEGYYGAWWHGKKLEIHRNDFTSPTIRLTYYVARKRLVAEDKAFRLHHFMHKFHWVGGYQQERFVCDAWAFMVDLVALGVITWVIGGIVMWRKSGAGRLWGTMILSAGVLCFAMFLVTL